MIRKKVKLVFIKKHIALIKHDDICNLDNYLAPEIRLQNEKCLLTCIYQNPDEFQYF